MAGCDAGRRERLKELFADDMALIPSLSVSSDSEQGVLVRFRVQNTCEPRIRQRSARHRV